MAKKVTEMKLKVDLQCSCCYKKVKQILCKFPEIRDQVYDEKNNIVKITVICCNPEKIRDKLCCMGRKVIISIEIVPPPQPPTQTSKPATPPPPPPPTQTSKPATPPPPPPPPPPCTCKLILCPVPIGFCCCQCYKGYPCDHCSPGCGKPGPPPPCSCCRDGGRCRRGCSVGRCDCFCEEYPSHCSNM